MLSFISLLSVSSCSQNNCNRFKMLKSRTRINSQQKGKRWDAKNRRELNAICSIIFQEGKTRLKQVVQKLSMITYLGIPVDLLGAGLVLGHIIKCNASVHLTTTTDIQRCGRIRMECGLVAEHYETPYFHSRHRRPPSWKNLAEKGSIKNL